MIPELSPGKAVGLLLNNQAFYALTKAEMNYLILQAKVRKGVSQAVSEYVVVLCTPQQFLYLHNLF